jgi:hypothetical protein
MPDETIDQVIEQLDTIVSDAERDGSPLGYFAALYRKVTVEVARGIREGRFEDGERMEKLDVRFARRYIDALDAFLAGDRVTESWRVCFAAAKDSRPIVLQHLMLGMNAHINLDLGIAAARTAPGSALPSLQGDFNDINGTLSSLVDEVQRDLARVWPLLGPLDRLAIRGDERIADFSMKVARDHAWRFAERLAPLDADDQEELIGWVDAWIAAFGRRLQRPHFPMRLVMGVIRLGEPSDVSEIIRIMA